MICNDWITGIHAMSVMPDFADPAGRPVSSSTPSSQEFEGSTPESVDRR